MIIWWTSHSAGGSGGCDYPPENRVVKGEVYADGSKTGTYVPNVRTTNPKFSAVPNVSGAMLNWFQQMIFTSIVKSVVNFQNKEQPTEVTFMGVWQVFTPQQLMMKPEGQRDWKWFTCHSDPSLALDPDDVITYETVQYRVMEKIDHTLYGFIEYHLVQDWEGSGPT